MLTKYFWQILQLPFWRWGHFKRLPALSTSFWNDSNCNKCQNYTQPLPKVAVDQMSAIHDSWRTYDAMMSRSPVAHTPVQEARHNTLTQLHKLQQWLVSIHAAYIGSQPGPSCSWRDAQLEEHTAHKHTSVLTQSQSLQHDCDILDSAVVLSPNPPAIKIACSNWCVFSFTFHFYPFFTQIILSSMTGWNVTRVLSCLIQSPTFIYLTQTFFVVKSRIKRRNLM